MELWSREGVGVRKVGTSVQAEPGKAQVSDAGSLSGNHLALCIRILVDLESPDQWPLLPEHILEHRTPPTFRAKTIINSPLSRSANQFTK